MVVIDFSTPSWLITYYHVIGIISIFLNSFGLYLLMFQSSKLDKIRYYMLAYQIFCFIADAHMTFLMQPVPLYPMLGGFTVGVLAEWFDISTHVSMMFEVFIVVVQLECLILCFEKKHQAIARILNIHVLPDWFLRCCYSLVVICPMFICVWFHTVRLSREDQWMIIRRDWKQYIHIFEHLSHFDVYVKTWWFIFLMVTTLGGGIAMISFFLLFILDIFRMMTSLKLKISATHYQKHKEALQSLMVQFATASFCLLPPCCLVIIVILELDQAQLLSELCILWFSTHSSANMVSLLIFFPPYRDYILKRLRLKKSIEILLNGGKTSNVVQPLAVPRIAERQSVLSIAEVS